MRVITPAVALVLGFQIATAKNLSGVVLDANNVGIAGVKVRLAVAKDEVLTRADGSWFISSTASLAAPPTAAPEIKLGVQQVRGRLRLVSTFRNMDPLGRRMSMGAEPNVDQVKFAASVKPTILDTIVFSKTGLYGLSQALGSLDTTMRTVLAASPLKALARVAGATYSMGSTGIGGATPHKVTLNSFYIDTNEVTQALYKSITGTNPSSHANCDSCPVENVSWYQALRFCNLRSAKEGRLPAYDLSNPDSLKWTWNSNSTGYRLPTEAEWEYAAKGGVVGDWYWGQNPSDAGVSPYAWFGSNSKGGTHQSGILKKNGYGLHDMAGNVWEWVWDWNDILPSVAQTNPRGPAKGYYRVNKGGGYDGNGIDMATTQRNASLPYNTWKSIGFRCALDTTAGN